MYGKYPYTCPGPPKEREEARPQRRPDISQGRLRVAMGLLEAYPCYTQRILDADTWIENVLESAG